MAMTTDIRNFVGTLIRLMIDDDKANIQELYNAIYNYNMSIDIIQNITNNIDSAISHALIKDI
jgi:hypothetical protein